MASEFRGTGARRGDQISLSGLDRLAEMATVAGSPYINGPGYYGVTGNAIASTDEVNPALTTGYSFTDTPSNPPYPNFSNVQATSLTVSGLSGMTLFDDGNGDLFLGQLIAGPSNNGYMATVGQVFRGDKSFLNNVMWYSPSLINPDTPAPQGSISIATAGYANAPTDITPIGTQPSMLYIGVDPNSGGAFTPFTHGVRIGMDQYSNVILFDSTEAGLRIMSRGQDGLFKAGSNRTMIDGSVFTNGWLTLPGTLFAVAPNLLGSTGGNTALTNLIAILADLGLLVNLTGP